MGIAARKVMVLMIGMVALAGCATAPKSGEYGPSPYAHGKLPGWQKPYTVRGRSYEPLQDHEGFSQEGTASWYGEDFHGKWTSNGELYDMYDMTAAHKTLPLGVWVKVTNKKNGREAVVRINDRGPFVGERIIDMSYAGAKTLGMVGEGIAPVRIEALGFLAAATKKDDPPKYKAPPNYTAGNFGVQVGAFAVAENARQVYLEAVKHGQHADLTETTQNGKTVYRVRAGKFPTIQEAEEYRQKSYPQGVVVSLN